MDHVDCMEQITSTHTILVGKLEGKSPLRRSRHEREDNVKIDLKIIPLC